MTGAVSPPIIYSTCPHRPPEDGAGDYLSAVIEASRLSEAAGHEGMLIYAANEAPANPWALAQVVIGATRSLTPLVAVNPLYMHPFTAANMIASMACLFRRRTDLNLIAGGFANDVAAFGDTLGHDGRYRRLMEYASILSALLSGAKPVTFSGEFYQIDKMKLREPVPEALRPRLFVSGSSDASKGAARRLDAVWLRYPTLDPGEPEDGSSDGPGRTGVRLCLVVRPDSDDAWRAARQHYPDDRRGQVRHMLAMSVSDSLWHRRLSELGERASADNRNPFWLGPFRNDQDYAPCLVGDYGTVGSALALLMKTNQTWFVVNAPRDRDDARHMSLAFEQALAMARAA